MATPKGRGRALARRGAADAVSVTLDPRRKKRFHDLMTQMAGAQRDEASGFDAYWEAVGEIIARGLFVAGGHETADAFLKAVVKQPKRSAMRLIRVARHASPAEEVKYGTAVLDAALAYIEALTGGPIEGRLPIAFEKLRVPVVRNGKSVKVGLDEATLREISTATRALTAKSVKARPRRPPAEAALASALHKEKDLSGITVSLADGHVRFGPVPFAAVAAFGRALAAAKLDVKEAPPSEGASKKAAAPKRSKKKPARSTKRAAKSAP